MINCDTVKNRLSAYIDRELSGEDMLKIREHLRNCEICKSEEAALISVKRSLGNLSQPAVSPELANRILYAVEQSSESQGISEKFLRFVEIFRPQCKRVFALSAVLMLVFTLAIMPGLINHDEHQIDIAEYVANHRESQSVQPWDESSTGLLSSETRINLVDFDR